VAEGGCVECCGFQRILLQSWSSSHSASCSPKSDSDALNQSLAELQYCRVQLRFFLCESVCLSVCSFITRNRQQDRIQVVRIAPSMGLPASRGWKQHNPSYPVRWGDCASASRLTTSYCTQKAVNTFSDTRWMEITCMTMLPSTVGVTLGGTGVRTPHFLERGTDPLTFCDHLVPKYYKPKTRCLPEVYNESMQDCSEESSSQNVHKLTIPSNQFLHAIAMVQQPQHLLAFSNICSNI